MIDIAILGSTGSIGITTLNIIRKDKKNFNVKLLTANSNGKLLFDQAKEFKVKNVIIPNIKKNHYWIKKFQINKIKTFDNYSSFRKILKNKIDYTINAISGIDGLQPTISIIKYTRKIAIANKESIICGWNLIKKELIKNKTEFIPVDSEHFSIFELINEKKKLLIKKVIITASGGPFLNKKNDKNVTVKEALKHPNWKMGKKISIDSSTLMNKVLEVIEAKKIFDLNMNKIDILINPNSYIHAIIIFNNGTIKFLAHETKMDIPIFNSIYKNQNSEKKYQTKELDIKKINSINLSKPNIKKFKFLRILNMVPEKDSLFETILVSVNDELVHKFLNNKIKYKNLSFYLMKIIKFKVFNKYYKIQPKSVKQILNVRNFAKKIVNENIN
tara:strand:- start:4602 stop:5762 length:1161 start_codon:yes stop_codon:yes gene_type:complete